MNSAQIDAEKSTGQTALRALLWAMLFGLVATACFALQAEDHAEFFRIASVGVAAAGACLLSGAILGFIFGIPKSLQGKQTETAGGKQQGSEKGEAGAVGPRYAANTNLEEISDWLTKMLVGVGLTQLYATPGRVKLLTEYIARGMGDSAYSQSFALGQLLYFVPLGFLFAFLWTRLYLGGALREADLAMNALKAIKSRDDQLNTDRIALRLADRQLNPSADEPPAPQEQLNEAVAKASPAARSQIFYDAAKLRKLTWAKDKEKMERTIPVFRALINSDKEDRYHANHGQLGFALKDQRKPDCREAEAELTKAIEIRKDWRGKYWPYYEMVRAICRVKLDEAYRQRKPSNEQAKKAILDDLRATYEVDETKSISRKYPEVGKWMSLNKVTPRSLVASGPQKA
jgi:hypothetical protein